MDLMEMNRDILFSTFVAWSIIHSDVYANLIGSEYGVTYGCDITYGAILETLKTTRSITDCSVICNGNDRCYSVKYDLVNKECQLNSERFLWLSMDCSSMMRYAKLKKDSRRKLINDDCTESSECSVPSRQCLLNKCQCDPGYSYNYTNESCITSCDSYGSTFTVYLGYVMYYHNDKSIFNVLTRDDCVQACLDETTFVCRTADYKTNIQECYLSTATAFTDPHDYLPENGVYHHHRNCKNED